MFHTTRDEHRLWYNFEISRRTVRAQGADHPLFILEIHQRQQCLWYKLSNSRRTVRTPGANRLPYRSSPQPEKTPSLVHFELERRTVRPPGPDYPPANLNSHSSSTGSLVRVRTVSATEADCPHLCSQLSNLIFFKSLKTSLALMHASRNFEQNGTKDPSTTSTRPLLIVRLSIQQIRSFFIH